MKERKGGVKPRFIQKEKSDIGDKRKKEKQPGAKTVPQTNDGGKGERVRFTHATRPGKNPEKNDVNRGDVGVRKTEKSEKLRESKTQKESKTKKPNRAAFRKAAGG